MAQCLQHRTSCASARRPTGPSQARTVVRLQALPSPLAIWTRPTPDRNEDWVKPSYVPQPNTQPAFVPSRREEQPLYAPSMPEFRPAELPDKSDKEMPEGPKMPERRPDPIPAGNPKKERPGEGEQEKREAPPRKDDSE